MKKTSKKTKKKTEKASQDKEIKHLQSLVGELEDELTRNREAMGELMSDLSFFKDLAISTGEKLKDQMRVTKMLADSISLMSNLKEDIKDEEDDSLWNCCSPESE